MGNIKEINTKNQTYYSFDDINNIEDFYPVLLRIDKNTDIYYIGYSTTKNVSDCKSINSVNPFYCC